MGLQARSMSQALRKLTGAIKRSNTAVLLTDTKLGVMFGNPDEDALKLHAAVRMDTARWKPSNRVGRYRELGPRACHQEQGGSTVQDAEFDIMFDRGISRKERAGRGCRIGRYRNEALSIRSMTRG